MRGPESVPDSVRPTLSFVDRIIGLKDTLLASPGFRRFAIRFPLTRPIARRRARALFDLTAGFAYSQILLACVQLNLFELLKDGPQTPAWLAHRMGLHPEAALRLLRAATSLRLAAERTGGRFGLGVLGAALVGNPAIAAMVVHHGELYADLRDPVALLRGEAGNTALRQYWAYAQEAAPAALKPEQVAAYTDLMAASQPLVADEILDAFAPRGHLHWLDVGGGDGSFVCAAARRYPKLTFTLFDLPGVAAKAAQRLHVEGLTDRVAVIGGDFRRDPLPKGADVISLVRVIHDHDDEAALDILRAVRAALSQEGLCVIAEPMAGASGAEPIGDAYFGFYLLAMGQGRARTPAELTELLHRAGFRGVKPRRTRMPLLAGILIARP